MLIFPLRAEWLALLAITAILALSANRFNVHTLANRAVKADIVFSTQPVEGESLSTMATITIILQLIAIIAVIVFIVYTVTVHKHINAYIDNLEQILRDHQVYLKKELAFRHNVEDIMNRCINLITVCNNTDLEVISKLRHSNRDKDNKYNAIVSHLNAVINLIKDNNNAITELNNKAKFSFNTENFIFHKPTNEERNTQLKTAKKPRFIKENGVNKKTKR